jgi:Putative MetA-pathway of phenol degradation
MFVKLSDHWDAGMQTKFDVNRNQESSGYNAGFVNTVSFGYKINDQLSSYFELFTNQTTEKGASFIATFDTGLKYLLTNNVQLDAGINVGITDAADDY